jgi:hypothetical protein
MTDRANQHQGLEKMTLRSMRCKELSLQESRIRSIRRRMKNFK